MTHRTMSECSYHELDLIPFRMLVVCLTNMYTHTLMTHLEVVQLLALHEGAASTDGVRCDQHEQEGRGGGEHVVPQHEPLVLGEHLREHGLQQGPRVDLK